MLNTRVPANTFAIAQGFKRPGQQNAVFIDYLFVKDNMVLEKKNFGVTFLFFFNC
jgi:hypothetical protein